MYCSVVVAKLGAALALLLSMQNSYCPLCFIMIEQKEKQYYIIIIQSKVAKINNNNNIIIIA